MPAYPVNVQLQNSGMTSSGIPMFIRKRLPGGSRGGRRGWVLLVVLAIVSGCQLLAPPEEKEAPPDLIFQDLELESYKNGKLEARGFFDELRHHTRQQQANADGIRWRPVGRAGNEEGELKAGKGEANLRESVSNLADGVRYRAADGLLLKSASARVNFSEQTARSDEETVLESDGFRSVGERFSAKGGEDGWIRLEGNVRSVLGSEPEDSVNPAESKAR